MTKRATHYWLMKTEPDVYSIDDLARDGSEPWDGVRNYQARNHMRDMRLSDLVLFYHSNAKPPGVAGIGRICREAYPDESQFDPDGHYFDPKSSRESPRWDRVDVGYVETLPRLVPLQELKDTPDLDGMLVVRRGQRLSVQPVEKAHFKTVLAMAGAKLKLR